MVVIVVGVVVVMVVVGVVVLKVEGLPVDVVHLCRDLLLRELATEGHILLDATYATAPTGGFTITLGFSRYNSFVPVYCAVFARQGTRAKVGTRPRGFVAFSQRPRPTWVAAGDSCP